MEYTVAAVDEALGLLMIVAAQPGLGVSELGRRSGNTKARAFRLLCTLEGRGFVERHGDPAVYHLGRQALLMGMAASEQISLVNRAQRYLRELHDLFNELVQVRVRDGLETVCVALVDSTQDMRVSTHIGRRRPLHAGSSGKVHLAFASEEIRQAVLTSELHRFTSDTVTQRSKLLQELIKVRSQGYAVSASEVSMDVKSVAAPIRDGSGEVIATLGLSAPAGRADAKAMKAFVDAIVSRANALSRDLGATLSAVA